MRDKVPARLLRWITRLKGGHDPRLSPSLLQHGAGGVVQAGHRQYVGGMWDEMGRLQFEFLRSEGLRPEHVVLDIACGSLRAGVHLVPYLDCGHYLGIDKEAALIEAGLRHELGRRQAHRKKPEFQVSADFDFSGFSKRPDYAIAQSLFTHLPATLVDQCFQRLRAFIHPTGRFYATFFERHGAEAAQNPEEPHDHRSFLYTRGEIESFGTRHGWRAEYIGGWNHPRGQIIVRYHPC
jgi:SAM-dependent methyltransferase